MKYRELLLFLRNRPGEARPDTRLSGEFLAARNLDGLDFPPRNLFSLVKNFTRFYNSGPFPVLFYARAESRSETEGYLNERLFYIFNLNFCGCSTCHHSRTQSPSYARCDETLWPNPYPNWHLIG
jgi:hypothetical protein